MAVRYAVASGNWSAPATWDGGVSIPAVGDNVYSNGFTVTVDGSYTVLTVSNAPVASPVIATSGTFTLTNGVTLTATGGFYTTSTVSLAYGTVTCSLGVGSSATVVGSVNGGTLNNNTLHCTVQMSGLGTLNIIGDCIAGGAASVRSDAGTLNITGNITGTTLFNGGPNVHVSGGTVNLTGDVNAAGSNAASQAALIVNTPAVGTVTGNIYGLSGAGSIGVSLSGRLVHIGSSVATQNGCAVVVSAGGSVICSGPLINWPGPTNIGRPAVLGPGALMVHEDYISTFYLEMYQSNASGTIRPTRRFYAAEAASVFSTPAEVDVRSGTVYGPGSEFTGTLIVPPVGSVALGVPVDATVGTAAITQQAIADAVGPLIAAFGS